MTRVILTYADYSALPDDGRRYELHEGELSVTPAPGTRHQRVKANLFVILFHHVRSRGLGDLFDAPTDCIMSDITVVQPDILFVDAGHASRVSERAIEGAPTLAIEILSPSTEHIDRRRKLHLYARHGVAHYWIVDPVARTIDAYTLEDRAYTVSARLSGEQPAALPPFDDLALDPASIWP
jgi:Uma2 family endonuclease